MEMASTWHEDEAMDSRSELLRGTPSLSYPVVEEVGGAVHAVAHALMLLSKAAGVRTVGARVGR